jgi:hypothetical protein
VPLSIAGQREPTSISYDCAVHEDLDLAGQSGRGDRDSAAAPQCQMDI